MGIKPMRIETEEDIRKIIEEREQGVKIIIEGIKRTITDLYNYLKEYSEKNKKIINSKLQELEDTAKALKQVIDGNSDIILEEWLVAVNNALWGIQIIKDVLRTYEIYLNRLKHMLENMYYMERQITTLELLMELEKSSKDFG